MKRFILVILVFCCVACISTSVLADAKMTAVNKTLITFEGDWKGFFFAKVENSGDAAGYLESGGKLVGFNADDDIILTENYVSSYPSRLLLEPGEYAYVREYFLENALRTDSIVDYKFSIKAENRGNDYTKIPCETSIEYLPLDKYNNYVYITFPNTSDSILYEFAMTVAIYDQNKELVFVNGDSNSSIGIHPGSTITVKSRIDSDLVEYYARNGITLSTVEAFVYIEKNP